MITHLAPEWEKWITSNLARGVPPPVLVQEMAKKNFDLVFAAQSVARFSPEFSDALAQAEIAAQAPQQSDSLPAGFESHYLGFAPVASRIAEENAFSIDGHRLTVTARCAAPDIVALGDVLTIAECDELIALSRPKLKRSTIVDNQTGKEEVIDQRSSEGTFFLRSENGLVDRIERRVAKLLGIPPENGEGIQILHYGVGAEYTPHFDFFPPENPGSAAHLAKGGQRTVTVILYLNDVDSGGATIFPDIRFAVVPKKGGAVYFSYCDDAGRLDRLTLHGGAPVVRGEKWIATLWYRQRAYF